MKTNTDSCLSPQKTQKYIYFCSTFGSNLVQAGRNNSVTEVYSLGGLNTYCTFLGFDHAIFCVSFKPSRKPFSAPNAAPS